MTAVSPTSTLTLTRRWQWCRISQSAAWLLVFIPALTYLLITRLGTLNHHPHPSPSGVFSNRHAVVVCPPAHDKRRTSFDEPSWISLQEESCLQFSSLFFVQTLGNDLKACCRTPTAPAHHGRDEETNYSPRRLHLPLQYSWMVAVADRSSVATKSKTATATATLTTTTSGTCGAWHAVVDTVWRHDPELGRGYLLISDAAYSGRIWRWEVGGGPITIGKTLFLDQAGCRSRSAANRRRATSMIAAETRHAACPQMPSSSRKAEFVLSSTNQTAATQPHGEDRWNFERSDGHLDGIVLPRWGSGALALDWFSSSTDHHVENRNSNSNTLQPEQHRHAVGALVMAEWGEGRIIRLEPTTGARTPLVVRVPPVPMNVTTTTTAAITRAMDEQFVPSAFTDDATIDAGDGSRLIKRNNQHHQRDLRMDEVCHHEHHDSASVDKSTHPRRGHAMEWNRIHAPTRMIYTPNGDLLVLDHPLLQQQRHEGQQHEDTAFICTTAPVIYVVPRAVQIPPLDSLRSSRRAHAWNSILDRLPALQEEKEQDRHKHTTRMHLPLPSVLWWSQSLIRQIGDMVWANAAANTLLLTVQFYDGTIALLQVSLTRRRQTDGHLVGDQDLESGYKEENNDNEDDLDNDEQHGILQALEPKRLLNLTRFENSVRHPGYLAVTQHGPLFWAIPNVGVFVLKARAAIDVGGSLKSATNKQKGQTTEAAASTTCEDSMDVLGWIPFPTEHFAATSLTLGGDGYLYVTTHRSLLRLRTRVMPLAMVTNPKAAAASVPHTTDATDATEKPVDQ